MSFKAKKNSKYKIQWIGLILKTVCQTWNPHPSFLSGAYFQQPCKIMGQLKKCAFFYKRTKKSGIISNWNNYNLNTIEAGQFNVL